MTKLGPHHLVLGPSVDTDDKVIAESGDWKLTRDRKFGLYTLNNAVTGRAEQQTVYVAVANDWWERVAGERLEVDE